MIIRMKPQGRGNQHFVTVIGVKSNHSNLPKSNDYLYLDTQQGLLIHSDGSTTKGAGKHNKWAWRNDTYVIS